MQGIGFIDSRCCRVHVDETICVVAIAWRYVTIAISKGIRWHKKEFKGRGKHAERRKMYKPHWLCGIMVVLGVVFLR